ncbi:DUF1266 domain-containing protein [Clavibacter nebraskensis]|uniref:Hypothetical membrane proteim n=1 Tax=Clavibacter nebraskensis NCPPB 2581 TaxID=1097677 RepID=A0AAI8ZKD8_9MICO|nr:DUF1266 domain-containing protein [Clavibacter nebraskensis]QGV67690.1 DUF1266 domain-containing protein [Clavibacter nebraskensis]UQB07583.1 DUF1266 domain-containing protein [Clavibacter nebraskensis]CCE76566.1 hypothetical membrane proteim [Clavibacter nebraskensis NCPPB 2581]
MTLQNHPGDVEFPVQMRNRHARAADAARRTAPAALRRRALLITAWSAPFAIVALVIAVPLADRQDMTGPPVVAVLAFMLGVTIVSVAFHLRDARAPLAHQRAYVAAAGRAPVTLEQQQLLALDAVSDFSYRLWNSSLAFQPTFAELPAGIRERHADGATGTGGWPALPIASLAQQRAALDSQFRIASRTDLELFVADAMTDGLVSARFAEVAAGPDAERMVARMAALTGRSEFEVMERTRPRGDRPPVLLLAGDSERTIGAIRYAYVAGYLPADDAWALIREVGARVFAAYDGWDAYWADVALALAFRTDSLETVQAAQRVQEGLRTSGWPAAKVPWPGEGAPVG